MKKRSRAKFQNNVNKDRSQTSRTSIGGLPTYGKKQNSLAPPLEIIKTFRVFNLQKVRLEG